MSEYSIGLEVSDDDVAALLVNCADGKIITEAKIKIDTPPLSVRDEPHSLRQKPSVVVDAVHRALAKITTDATSKDIKTDDIIGIGVATTASSILPIDEMGLPLAENDLWKDNPNAMLWCEGDESAFQEAKWITESLKENAPALYKKTGGVYSESAFWSKVWHCYVVDSEVAATAHSWVELSDYIPAVLTDNTEPAELRRNISAAAHRALYDPSWGGLPEGTLLATLNAELTDLRERLYEIAFTPDIAFGALGHTSSDATGLSVGTPVAVGMVEAHAGALAMGGKPGRLATTIAGDATHIALLSSEEFVAPPAIKGLTGSAYETVMSEHFTIEAVQASVGTALKWVSEITKTDINELDAKASEIKIGSGGLLALDWLSGSRSPLNRSELRGAVVGLTPKTTPEAIYRAMVEAGAFNAREILEIFQESKVEISELILSGMRFNEKSLLPQIWADVLGVDVHISSLLYPGALGAAGCGAVVAGAHPDLETARDIFIQENQHTFSPNPAHAKTYNELYNLRHKLSDIFTIQSNIMRSLTEFAE